MATATSVKSFSPEETQTILQHLKQPAVFLNMTRGWPVLHWTAEHLCHCLGDGLIRFRLGRKEETNAPLFETQCSYVEAKLDQFLRWSRGQAGTDVGPFCDYPYSEYWAYADYKYIAMLFQDQPSMFEDVKWSDFGFEGRDGRDSTLWIGTQGANTPCHLDSYGCNLVLQVQGRKRWHLFPPEDTCRLYPTRIPYEESSVFSQVDVICPDLGRFPAFQRARAHTVTLQPGQVLYVPKHWWHYVESVDPVTVSVNSWIELEGDDVARVSEAVTKAVVCALKSTPSGDNTDEWLNPTEERVTSHDENMQYLNLAVKACAGRQRSVCHSQSTQGPKDARLVQQDSDNDSVKDPAPAGFPFGPHLIPVRCNASETNEGAQKDLLVKSSRNLGDCTEAPARESASAVRPHLGKQEHSPGLYYCRPCDRGDGNAEHPHPSEGCRDSRHTIITTNDLLDCLVHPDIIAHVTELLLKRHRGSHRSTMSPQL